MLDRTCGDCGARFTPSHGRHLYCEAHRGAAHDHRREQVARTCTVCGAVWMTCRRDAKFCTDSCKAAAYAGRPRPGSPRKRSSALPKDHPVMILTAQSARLSRLSPIRRAVEMGDRSALIEAVRSASRVTSSGCWAWGRRVKDGYPLTKLGDKTVQVHRLVLEAKHGAPLGNQAAHHVCANSVCVNPDHLQPVTARDNTAEMLARTYMVQRIRDLEAALAAVRPQHPLLTEIGLPLSA